MKSIYLEHLNRKIDAATQLAEQCYLRAERAGFLARFGELENARQEVQEVKTINLTLRNGRVSVAIGIADGLCKYYGGSDTEAYEILKRARVLGVALGQSDLIAKAACWLAFLEYGSQSFERMFHFMSESVSNNTESEDPSTSARLALLLAQTLHLGNRFDLASSWYRAAHAYASSASDGATISALMHNMASIWTTNTRNEVLGGMKTSDTGRIALAGAISTLNLDSLLGSTSFDYFTPLMLAQLHSLEGKWAEAICLYQDRITNVELRAAKGWQAWMLSDLGWCLLKSGKTQEAQSYIDAAKKAVRSDQHPDDQAATYRRLADSSVEIGQNEEVEGFRQRSDLKWREYLSLQKHQLNQAMEFAETKKSYFGLVKRNSINGLTLHENNDSDRL